jgi:DNA-3-methyladenine glycosylase
VYFNYGMHYLVNAVTEAEGSPAAILIRALAPIEGIDRMRRRRARVSGRLARLMRDDDLCRGPANLCVALGIDLRQNGRDLTSSPLRIEDRGVRPPDLVWSPRIGIRVGTDRPWRCHWAGHESVSGSRRVLTKVGSARL